MRLRCVSPNLPICRASFAYRATSPSQSFRSLSTYASSFVRHVSHPSSLHQLYISHANDPFLNLSIEHFLLTHTPPTSTTLFLYANRPSVIIGRNQNPWLESNLRALRSPSASLSGPANPPIDLVRRRSGGGAVFHDGGNINYSVLCPPAAFARDLHAAMLARALRRSNPRARVNERHDVVLDQGGLLPEPRRPPADDARTSAYEPGVPLKVSGSAYKITRTRALHHGTCLVASPNVGRISGLLRSPARPYVKARGVDSVRSPVGNAYTEAQSDAVAKFTKDVLDEFCTMHGLDMSLPQKLVSQKQASSLETFDRSVYGWLGGELAEVPEVCAGMEELKSPSWLYTQTPQFTFSTHPTDSDPRPRPPLPNNLPPSTKIVLTFRSASVTFAEFSLSASPGDAELERKAFSRALEGVMIYELRSWCDVLERADGVRGVADGLREVGMWLDEAFGLQGRDECASIPRA